MFFSEHFCLDSGQPRLEKKYEAFIDYLNFFEGIRTEPNL